MRKIRNKKNWQRLKTLHTTSIICLLALASCSMEEKDTRLVCDCNYIVEDYKETACYSDSYKLDNNSLVFNESKKKFTWNGLRINNPTDEISFYKDLIYWEYDDDIGKFIKSFDRINLVYKDIAYTKSFDLTKVYQCRVVEGV